ncbi:mitochondrial inner membrane m-AAA protease component paraplegin [Epargyreus clarus]|uniref:mitochondrial inner membrane m-AAA protease component paraplegin n=1 Tax=Epargyreus clarus TaxID=520877 RepID=UPI003C2D45D1
MLSIKRLPTLSASKIHSKIRVDLNNLLLERKVNKHYHTTLYNLCKSASVLHSLTRKSKNQQLRHFNAEYKAACALFNRSNLAGITSAFSKNGQFRSIHTTSPSFHQNEDKDKDKKDGKNDDANIPSLLMKAAFWMFTTCVLVVMSSLLMPTDNTQNELIRYVSWNEFVYSMLSKGEVDELIVRPDLEVVTIILHEGAIIKGKRTNHRVYHMNVGDIHRFEEKLRETEKNLGVKEGVRVIYDRNGGVAAKVITTLLLGAVILSFLYSTKSMKMNINLGGFSQLSRAKFTLVDSMSGQGKGVKFEDVAGLREAKIEVMEFVDYLKRPEHYKSLGAKVPKGALLLGPPGCGKTLLAKAVATEANVPFLSMNGSEFIEMIGGLGAARVRDLFKEAVSRAPCIIYIDEMDAVGRARSTGAASWGPGGGEGEQTLNQLLVEMDGMKSREGVVVLASTNRADVLDKALLRPGRFDRHILIDLPTLLEREEIFERHLKNIVLEELPPHYVKRLAYLTPGFSGADIANVCNEAALHAARHKQSIVRAADLDYAVERVVGGTEKRSHAMSPGEKKIVAYHESGHALVGWLLEHTDALLKVTIVPRTNMALGFAQYTTSDQKLYSKEELYDRMCMALGGRAAEAITFNSITSGAQNDLEKVTKIAYAQVRVFGMSPTVGLVSFPDMKDRGKSPFSKTLKNLIDLEARKLIASAYYRTETLLRDNQEKLKALAEELLKKETLNFNQVKDILGPPPFPRKKFIDPVEFENSLKNMENAATADDTGTVGAPSAKPQPQPGV